MATKSRILTSLFTKQDSLIFISMFQLFSPIFTILKEPIWLNFKSEFTLTVMLVTTIYWLFDDGERFKMLVTESICWWRFSLYYIGHKHLKLVTNTFRLQHPSPTSMPPNLQTDETEFSNLREFIQFMKSISSNSCFKWKIQFCGNPLKNNLEK